MSGYIGIIYGITAAHPAYGQLALSEEDEPPVCGYTAKGKLDLHHDYESAVGWLGSHVAVSASVADQGAKLENAAMPLAKIGPTLAKPIAKAQAAWEAFRKWAVKKHKVDPGDGELVLVSDYD
jgi:hypothetical protein